MQAANSVNGAARIGAEANGGRASSWHNGRGWTPAEIEELLNLSSTQTIRTIARKLGRTEKSVRRKLEQLGRTQELLTGFKTKDLARDLQGECAPGSSMASAGIPRLCCREDHRGVLREVLPQPS
ncbi:MAG: hypothetical protein IPP47_23150 [Bryobacterales bacterium]|nr:hypothetical protein [Bryobacterales bacterium]